MPEFYQESSFTSDQSTLTPGWHPAFLCLITEDAIPEGWQMGANGAKTMWRWHFAVWETPAHCATHAPEHQSAVSSRTFSPGGKNPASKAFLWTEQLINRRPNPGERINLDPMMPLPCRIKVARRKNDGTEIEYARVLDLEAYPDGAQLLTEAFKAKLLALPWVANPQQAPAPTKPTPQAPAPQPAATGTPPVNPGMVGWGNPQGTVTEPAKAPVW